MIDSVPNHSPSYKLLAAVNFSQGNLSRAQMFLDEYIVLEPDDPRMMYMLAEIHLHMGNAAQAAATIEDQLERAGGDAELLNIAGIANIFSGKQPEGTALLQKAVEADPADLTLQTRLAATLLNQGRVAEADRLMARWQPQIITEHSRQLLRLERFMRSGQINRASAYAKKLRRENPSNVHALMALAEIAHLRGKEDESLDWLEIASDRNEDALEPRILLAHLYLGAGDYQKAIHVLRQATASHPYNSLALSLLADASLLAQDTRSAVAAASEAYRMSPLTSTPRISLIRAQLASSDYWKARKALLQYLQDYPDKFGTVRQVVLEEMQRGNTEQALDLARHLQELQPDNPKTYELEGDLHVLNNDSEAASSAYRRALRRSGSLITAVKSNTAGTQ